MASRHNHTNRKKSRRRLRVSRTTGALAVILLSIGALAAVLIIRPSFSSTAVGGIELHGNEPEVEIYGPELPAKMVSGYSYTPVDSIIVTEEETSDENITYVYAATDGKCYHLSTCKFAYASSQKLTVYEATMLGKTPCGRCDPPVYESPIATTWDTADTQTSQQDDVDPFTGDYEFDPTDEI